MAQVLLMIDTCFSGEGLADVASVGSGIIESYRSEKKTNLTIHAISACRAKQYAENGAFAAALESVLINWECQGSANYISPDALVGEINQVKNIPDQNVQHNALGSEGSTRFFPVAPILRKGWNQKRQGYVQELYNLLKKDIEESLFSINTLLLAQGQEDDFIAGEKDLEAYLEMLSQYPVVQGVCPLMACVRWCQTMMQTSASDLVQELQTWHNHVLQDRPELNLQKIDESHQQDGEYLKQMLVKGQARLTVIRTYAA